MEYGYLASVHLVGQDTALFTVLLAAAPPIGTILVESDRFFRVLTVEILTKPIHSHTLVTQLNAGHITDPPASRTGILYVEKINPTHRTTA